MAELVIAPFFEPFENWVEPLIGVRLKMAIDRDIAGIANFFGEIGRIKDEFGPEIGVFFGFGQKAQVHGHARFAQRIVDKPGMPRLIPAHIAEELADIGVVAAALHFFVKHTARKLGRAG